MGLGLWLSIIVISVSAAFAVAGAYQKSRFTHYAFKPLTMVLVISLAWERTGEAPGAYGVLVLTALVFGLAGDVFLMLSASRFRQGMAAFGVGHALYIAALALGGPELSPLVLAVLMIYGTGLYLFLRPGLGRLRLPVIGYMATLLIMSWLAVGRFLSLPDARGRLVLAASLLFLFSDSVNGIKRFRKPFRAAEVLVLVPYFAAQLLFALSI